MTLTIFTPTYNRAHLLPRLFSSLHNQINKDFTWLIVDDGSTDNTYEVIENFKKTTDLKIKYIYQKNQGKHIAINTALANINTDLFLIIDSDDFLSMDFRYVIEKHIKYFLDTPYLIAIASPTKQIITNKLQTSKVYNHVIEASLLDMNIKYGITGEFSLIFKTDMAISYTYPVYKNEKFMRESLVYNRMGKLYKFLFVPESIVTAEYQENGLSNNIRNILLKSPEGATLAFKELMNNKDIPTNQRIYYALSFWDYATACNQSFFRKIIQINGFIIKILFLIKKFK